MAKNRNAEEKKVRLGSVKPALYIIHNSERQSFTELAALSLKHAHSRGRTSSDLALFARKRLALCYCARNITIYQIVFGLLFDPVQTCRIFGIVPRE
ncbi:hypothetical protein EVAR_16313_1 [Eumeta japonica]|uniref:Uncharacterized protein n=1 Tax=Eumeta variegata TaxID=151549 RepID=A0A4C1VE51_EUMVA|nr:hypothetical protein EVAR_16313_1 [Eumeta japonica]